MFHGFGKAKFADAGSILGSCQLTLLSQLPLNTAHSGVKIEKGAFNRVQLSALDIF